ncbi:(3S)-malyl-CoA thioesterase [Colwellia chukchiensis]|uniref:(3S)-malyl-CoA thioesterase n=1 Tax=Colwellia chukchiensis TaxID=641665 RepID=A0A1H7QZ31_9GAMM|nr:thioesterase family protein [Colwellia chukchiensis]SEL52915.1 (3S)-malyl-CoA thioesterase [Colwellia chukchiensis]
MSVYPFSKFASKIPADWVDFNGHMNTKYYGLVIYDAHIAFTEHLDLGERYRYANNCSKALVESHCIFERELCEGDKIEVISWLLSVDHKRLHTFHEIYCTNKGYRAAAGEHLDVHIDLTTRRVSPFPDDVFQRLQLIEQQYNKLPKPYKVGSRIKVPIKT